MKHRQVLQKQIAFALVRSFIPMACLLAMIDGLAAHAAEQTDAKPNVLLIVTDDQGYGDLSGHGNPYLQTPHLDELASQSIRFTDFHVAPMCTPTRAQLLTGRDCLATAAMNVSSGRTLLRTDLPTMADFFKAGGYKTGIFGKWHLGDNYPYRPQDRGFDESLWFPSSHIGSVPDAWNNDYFNDQYQHNGVLQRYDGYCTDIFFDEAMQWMRQRQAAEERFFAYIPLNAAHWPWFVPDEFRQPYHQREPNVASYYGMIANIDHNMGRLETMLKETGLQENTILIFMSDNGGTIGVPLYNAGMRGTKVQLWEGGHRVPCYVRWPAGDLGKPRDVGQLTHCQDWLPTLIELCGLPNKANVSFDGVSLSGLLRGKIESLADRMLVVQFSRMNVGRPQKGDAAVMWNRWRLLRGTELYDLRSDLAQEHNVIDRHAEVAAKMQAHYDKWWQRIEPSLDEFQPTHIGSDKENPMLVSACEWADVFVDQGVQVRRGERKNGLWHIQVEQAGEYEFRLRRWPDSVEVAMNAPLPMHDGEDGDYQPGVALPISKARLRIGQQDVSTSVTSNDREASFTLKLPAGRTTMQTWFYDKTGEEICGAYYVYVHRQ
jgi:arylsulfatase A-like enzyme